jgi:hypothetical protein
VLSKIILMGLLINTQNVFACRPAADFKAPTIRESFKAAELVFKGRVISQKDLGPSDNPFGTKYELEFAVEKMYKGKKLDKIVLTTYSSSCDTFGQSSIKESECIVFSTKDLKTVSGLFSGFASTCDLPNIKSLRSNVEVKEKEILQIK